MRQLAILILTLLSFSSIAQLQWQNQSQFPGSQRLGGSDFVINGKAYITHGRAQSSVSNSTYLNDFWSFDPTNNTWQNLGLAHGAKRGAGISAGNDSLGIIGLGWNSSTTFKDLYSYKQLSNTWDTLPVYPGNGGRNSFGAIANNYLVVGGGTENYSHPYDDDFWKLNLTTKVWTRINNSPLGSRATGTSFSWNGKVYFGMGHNGSTDFKDIWSFDPLTDTWTAMPDFPGTGRFGVVDAVYRDKVVVGGGARYGVGNALSDYYVLDLSTNSWTSLQTQNTLYAFYPLSFGIGNSVYVVSGYGTNRTTPNKNVNLLNFSISTGIDDAVGSSDKINLEIYPNPCSGILNIVGHELYSKNDVIQIYSIEGKLLKSIPFSNQIDLSDLQNGMYVCAIKGAAHSSNGLVQIIH